MAKTHWQVIYLTQQTPHNTLHSVTRQRKIEDCLLENLLSMSYDQISIADLCRQMGISRRLYYTYFPDKYTCLLSLIDRYVHDSINIVDPVAVPATDRLAQCVVILNYWKEHSDFLNMIVRQNLKSLLIDRNHIFFRDHSTLLLDFLSTPEIAADDSILWLFSAIRLTVLLQWHEQNYSLPVEEMAKKYVRMMTSPLIHNP